MGSSRTIGLMLSLPAEVMIEPDPFYFSIAQMTKSFAVGGMSSSNMKALMRGSI
jgi:hypothetical protein